MPQEPPEIPRIFTIDGLRPPVAVEHRQVRETPEARAGRAAKRAELKAARTTSED